MRGIQVQVEDGAGTFKFCDVEAEIDARFGERDGQPLAEFTWAGEDAGESVCGRGHVLLRGADADELEGALFMHQSEQSTFLARRAARRKRNGAAGGKAQA